MAAVVQGAGIGYAHVGVEFGSLGNLSQCHGLSLGVGEPDVQADALAAGGNLHAGRNRTPGYEGHVQGAVHAAGQAGGTGKISRQGRGGRHPVFRFSVDKRLYINGFCGEFLVQAVQGDGSESRLGSGITVFVDGFRNVACQRQGCTPVFYQGAGFQGQGFVAQDRSIGRMVGRVGFERGGGGGNQLGSGFAVAGQGKGGRQDPAGLRMHGILFHAVHGGIVRTARQGQRVEPVGLVHVREEFAGRHAISFAEALLGTFPTGEDVGIHRESLGGCLREEGSVHGRDPRINGAVGPVGKAATRLLAGVQPGNDIRNGCRCLPGLFLAQQGHQVQEREAFGGQLLGAVVRIVQHCPG